MTNDDQMIQELGQEMAGLMNKYLGKKLPAFYVLAALEFQKYGLMMAINAKTDQEKKEEPKEEKSSLVKIS